MKETRKDSLRSPETEAYEAPGEEPRPAGSLMTAWISDVSSCGTGAGRSRRRICQRAAEEGVSASLAQCSPDKSSQGASAPPGTHQMRPAATATAAGTARASPPAWGWCAPGTVGGAGALATAAPAATGAMQAVRGPARGPSAEPSFAEHSQGRRAAVCMSFVQQRGPSSSPSVPDTNFPILFLPSPWSSAKPLTTAHEWSHGHTSGNFISQSEQPGALPSPAHREGPPQPWPLEVWRGLLGCICLLLGGAWPSCGATCKPGPDFLLLHRNMIIWNIPEMIGADCKRQG